MNRLQQFFAQLGSLQATDASQMTEMQSLWKWDVLAITLQNGNDMSL